jgi:hypothetical protein
MRICWILALLGCSVPVLAISGGMQKATVHAMRKVPCTQPQSAGNSGFLAGLAGSNAAANECVEYELRTQKVVYTIRPRRDILLLLGGEVFIKLAESELLLRTSENVKVMRCSVVAMSLRSEAERREKERERERELSRSAPARCFTESGRELLCPDEP